jgi:8-oxo-(d)GTP phosphatase
MALLLVRHAAALPRHEWDGPDEERPLTGRGEQQAKLLVGQLERYAIERVLSSPSKRCVETVKPLADARGLAVELVDEMAEGSTKEALALARDHLSGSVVLCSHGDVIPYILEDLVVHDGADLGPSPQWAKGSTWVVEREESAVTLRYLRPLA